MTKTPQIMFRLSPENFAVVAERGKKSGDLAPSAYCKSIVLDCLSENLVEATKSADARFVGEKIAALTLKIESMDRAAAERHGELKGGLVGISETVSEAARDTFDTVLDVKKVICRVDQLVGLIRSDLIGDANSSVRNIAERIEQLAQDLYNALSDPNPTLADLSSSGGERRSSAAAFAAGQDRRTQSDRREHPRDNSGVSRNDRNENGDR